MLFDKIKRSVKMVTIDKYANALIAQRVDVIYN